ncbi:EamA family transporter [Flavivirga spongiicola]|uniref:EamA family transporter n=1 Tax=Flavivirga spongiicola TaxID=421621 RepID=A0ABU7XYJ9_9FLAO|nr:EamA family transporter [Flavivirga sp. MEBiC05379]MDO5980623.1 EamA family transporter [Flavivirga sp. MEBiC05379]
MSISRKTILIILAFFAIYVIWGSTYLLNKIAVTEIPPFFVAAIRFTIAGLIIFIIAKFMKLRLAISRKQFINCTIVGFLFLVYGNGVFIWALKYLDSGFAALEASTQPLFVLLLMRLLDGKKMQTKSLIGVALGIIGMYLLVSQKELVTNDESLLGMFMILTCVLSWSYASVFVAKADLPSNYFVSTAYQMIIAGVLLIIISLLLNENWVSPIDWSIEVQWSLILLILFGSVIAFTAFNYLLKVVSTEKAATSAYVNPIVAIILGWYVLDEAITTQTIIAACILLTGVFFITSRKRMKTRTIGS